MPLPSSEVSILHKCDYNVNQDFVLISIPMFQFYISAIITRACARSMSSSFVVSILHKCDYNQVCRVPDIARLQFQFYISAIITVKPFDYILQSQEFQFYISAIITSRHFYDEEYQSSFNST